MTRSRAPISQIRRNCANAFASLALRHWLSTEAVPHGLAPISPLTDPHARLITLGGRRLLLVNHLITNRDHVLRLQRNPQLLLHTPIPIDASQAALERLSPGDLLAFSFMLASICHSLADTRHSANASGTASLLAIPPFPKWRQQRPWRPLGRLTIANPEADLAELELCGLLADRSASIERLTIAAGRSLEMTTPWHNLLYARALRLPESTLRIECPVQGVNWIVTPTSWSNLWFYDPQLILAGWLTKRELEFAARTSSSAARARRRDPLPHGSPILAQAIRPIHELLQKARHI